VLDAIAPVSPELAPLLQWRRVLLAAGRGRQGGRPRGGRAGLQAGFAANGRPCPSTPSWRSSIWRSSGPTRRARPGVLHWVQGHGLLARVQPFSRADHRAFVDATIEHFDAARLQRGPRAANDDSVAGVHRRHAALRHDVNRADIGAHAQVVAPGARRIVADVSIPGRRAVRAGGGRAVAGRTRRRSTGRRRDISRNSVPPVAERPVFSTRCPAISPGSDLPR